MGNFNAPQANQGKTFKYPVSVDVSGDTLHPAFCFRYLQRKLCISDRDHKVKIAVANKLNTLGSLTWAQIAQSGHQDNGYEEISELVPRIPPEFGRRFPDTKVIGFYFGGDKGRMYGIRKDKLFYVFWLDWTPFKLPINH